MQLLIRSRNSSGRFVRSLRKTKNKNQLAHKKQYGQKSIKAFGVFSRAIEWRGLHDDTFSHFDGTVACDRQMGTTAV